MMDYSNRLLVVLRSFWAGCRLGKTAGVVDLTIPSDDALARFENGRYRHRYILSLD